MERPIPSVAPEVPPIPGYLLLEKIGEGGRGEVYRAQQQLTGRTVAIKFLRRLPTDESAVLTRRFRRESELMASLVHPHVVVMYECGKMMGQFYLIMEYIPGATLRDHLKPGEPWAVPRAIHVLDAIAQALGYIHGQGILHLDLKPENVLTSDQGTIKVTDFGLAVLQADAAILGKLGMAQGSIDYCAPEQRFGLRIDERSDLFALATIAYEMLTGQLPGRVYWPSTQRNPKLSAAVDEVLRRGLARDPDERYWAVEAFRHDLVNALES